METVLKNEVFVSHEKIVSVVQENKSLGREQLKELAHQTIITSHPFP